MPFDFQNTTTDLIVASLRFLKTQYTIKGLKKSQTNGAPSTISMTDFSMMIKAETNKTIPSLILSFIVRFLISLFESTVADRTMTQAISIGYDI